MRLLRRLLAGYALLLLATWVAVSRWSALQPAPPSHAVWPEPGTALILDEVGAGRVLAALRAHASGGPASPLRAGRWRGRAVLWCGGRARWSATVDSDGERLLAASPGPMPADGGRPSCRLRLDVERGRGPLLASIAPLLALSLVPGLDGIGLDFGGREVVLGPDELRLADLLAGYRPLAGVDLEMGLDASGAVRHLALAAGADASSWRRTPHRLFRVRSESWVEPATPGMAGATPIFRGLPPPPPLSRAALRSAALAGARYLERHLAGSGRFDYVYDPLADQVLPDRDYSFPRHAGAAWYLAEAAAALAEPALSAAAARALAYLEEHAPEGCSGPQLACAGNPGDRVVDLGASALTLLAALEYRRATADTRFDPWARRLGAFLALMQRPDGDFRHLYDLAAGRPDERPRLLYYSGEAAFALSRLAADPGTPAAERAVLAARVDRALAWLTRDNYAYFAGGFFYGEEHWTCLAVDDAWDLLAGTGGRDGYGDFCEGFAGFLDRSRFRAGDDGLGVQPDLAGAYGFTPLMPPQPTPAGSRTEALLAIHRVASRRGHGAAAARIASAVRDSLRFLLSRQVRAEGAWMMPDPAAADGGFPTSDVQPRIRIDFIQHACSAMLRAAKVPSLATDGEPGPRGGSAN